LPFRSTTPSSSKRTRKPAAAASSAEEDFGEEEDVIKEVHRDEEYGEYTYIFECKKIININLKRQ
jgi:hypothetical protein